MNFNHITKNATQVARSWTNKEKIAFHYFNPNGLYAKKKATDEIISQLVEQGKAKTGAIIAYGSMNSYSTDRLHDLYMKKRITDVDYHVWAEMMRDEIARAEKFIAETEGF